MAHVVCGITGGDKRFARHTAAQNTQTAKRSRIDECNGGAQIARRSPGGITAGARADDDDVVRMGWGDDGGLQRGRNG